MAEIIQVAWVGFTRSPRPPHGPWREVCRADTEEQCWDRLLFHQGDKRVERQEVEDPIPDAQEASHGPV